MSATQTAVPGQAGAAHPLDDVPRVNLLPESVRLRLVARRRLQWWASVVGVAMLLALASWQWSVRQLAEARNLRAQLADVQRRTQREHKQALTLATRGEVLRQQLATLQAMRAPEAWSQRLAELAIAVPDGAVLTRIRVGSVRADVTAVRGQRELTSKPAATELELQIDGHAVDHTALAAFLNRLQETGTYRRVELTRSAVEPAESNIALSFGVACRR